MKHDDEIAFKVTVEDSEVHYIEETRHEYGWKKRYLLLALVCTFSVCGLLLSGLSSTGWRYWALLMTYPAYGLTYHYYLKGRE